MTPSQVTELVPTVHELVPVQEIGQPSGQVVLVAKQVDFKTGAGIRRIAAI